MQSNSLENLFENNKAWAEGVTKKNPEFFRTLSKQQAPKYLWIGCSDSRVSADQIVGLMPGEIFVHRNIANVVVHTDLNCLSVMQYAVDALKVEHIIVTGHYGCGGVGAALQGAQLGLIDNWLRHVQDVKQKHAAYLSKFTDESDAHDRLCELNVIEQVTNVCGTTIVREAWKRGQPLAVHGWVYGLKDGLVRDLKATVSNAGEMALSHEQAVAALPQA